jgi:hypothetical protein
MKSFIAARLKTFLLEFSKILICQPGPKDWSEKYEAAESVIDLRGFVLVQVQLGLQVECQNG